MFNFQNSIYRVKIDDAWQYGNLVIKVLPSGDSEDSQLIKTGEFIARNGSSYVISDFSTVGQFTGLHDTNGCKIFTGDIVRYSDRDSVLYDEEETEFFGEVVFEAGAFGIACNKTIPLSLDCGCYCENFVSFWELLWNADTHNFETVDQVEVVGNIFDNQELLK